MDVEVSLKFVIKEDSLVFGHLLGGRKKLTSELKEEILKIAGPMQACAFDGDWEIKEYSRISKDDVDEVYKAYPTKCIITGRSSGKSSKDKERIKRLLRKNTKEKLVSTVEKYLEDCKENKVYMKNFSTFLNNLPDYPDEEEKPESNTVSMFDYRTGERRDDPRHITVPQ